MEYWGFPKYVTVAEKRLSEEKVQKGGKRGNRKDHIKESKDNEISC